MTFCESPIERFRAFICFDLVRHLHKALVALFGC